jgi:glyoxylase-like metal-dependent hydrolase (beta-lactamase superfamily II)
MKAEIFPFSLGFNDCYVIREQEVIMIDGGPANKKIDFIKAMKNIQLEPENIKLIVITDGHPDHIGSARDIKQLTKAKIAMHRLAKGCLEAGEWKNMRLPGGWMGRKVFGKIITRFSGEIPSTEVELVIDDDGLSLKDYGISGRIVYTPGHTMGSVSVLLDSGEAFVGDLAMNKFPLRLGPGLPTIVENRDKVKESWRKILDLGATTVYPAHGKPFSAEVIKKVLK